jgi:hypothetical protein
LYGTVESPENAGKPETKMATMLPQRKQREGKDCLKCGKVTPWYLLHCLIFLHKLYNVFPSIFKYLPGPQQKLFSNWEKLKLFVSRMMDSHREDWNPSAPRDFIDAFLTEMTKVRKMLPASS